MEIARGFLRRLEVPVEMEALYMLTSIITVKFTDPQAARTFVNDIRAFDQARRTVNGRVMWAAVYSTKERHTRNKRFLQTARALQKYPVNPAYKARPPYQLVRWRSATVVFGTKRICNISDATTPLQWCDGWYASAECSVSQAAIETEINNIA